MPAATIADLIRADHDVTAWCLKCQHHAVINPRDLLPLFGPRFRALDLAGKLVCSRCGSRETTTRLSVPRQPFSEGWGKTGPRRRLAPDAVPLTITWRGNDMRWKWRAGAQVGDATEGDDG